MLKVSKFALTETLNLGSSGSVSDTYALTVKVALAGIVDLILTILFAAPPAPALASSSEGAILNDVLVILIA